MSQEAATWCVEIKPKWGALPVSPYLRPQDAAKRAVPRFAMMQMYKLQYKEQCELLQGSITGVSDYDPRDLFSEEAAR